MIKKIIIVVILIVIIVVISILFLNSKNKILDDNNFYKKDDDIVNNSSVVIYFSVTGNTEKVANMIGETINSKVIELIPKEQYTDDDLDYMNDNSRANKEQNDENSRPEIANVIDNIESYDVIYLGYPIWWDDVPKIVLSFLDSYDLDGKTIVPFCTSGGSSIELSVKHLRSYNEKLNILDGKKFNTNLSKNEVVDWVNSLDIDYKLGEEKYALLIDGKEYSITLEDSETVRTLINKMPLDLSMNNLNGNEFYSYMDFTLPTNSYKPNRINKGDILLYGNDCLVIFYESFDTVYSYTKIGKLDNVDILDNLKDKNAISISLIVNK